MNKENIKKGFHNRRTWVALFSYVGLLLQVFGVTGSEGNLEKVRQAVYMFGIALGIWTDHEEIKGDAE
ncbi:hypothetical protein ACFQZ1_02250 [Bacillus sp. CGMCC 1.60114]|uniref:hypothetical protein n=1 Tax=unclassified Bacillus (in: firmicutes) TaxID=185979 RepID=UPI00363FD1D3